MTSSPSPPHRRRRPIVVTIAVLLVVSLIGLWYYPRGDARIVGKWTVDWLGDSTVDGVATFYWDGTASIKKGSFPPEMYWWRTLNDRLYLRPDTVRRSTWISGEIENITWQLEPDPSMCPGIMLYVGSITKNRLDLVQPNTAIHPMRQDHVVFIRLPE